MSLVFDILADMFNNTSLSYKGVKVNIFGIPKFNNKSYGSMRSTLSYMHKKNLIQNTKNGWEITLHGKKYLKRKENSLVQFKNEFLKNSPKNLIVMFDIPETKKAKREWFRFQLKKFNYIMIQKSVWVGPSPLPKEFTEYLKKINLKTEIKTFKLARTYKEKGRK